MKIEIEKVLSSYFDNATVKIKRSPDSRDLWAVSINGIPLFNCPKNLLMNPRNYPLIVSDLKLLLEEYVHGD